MFSTMINGFFNRRKFVNDETCKPLFRAHLDTYFRVWKRKKASQF